MDSATTTVDALNANATRLEVTNALTAYALMIVFFAAALWIGISLTRRKK